MASFAQPDAPPASAVKMVTSQAAVLGNIANHAGHAVEATTPSRAAAAFVQAEVRLLLALFAFRQQIPPRLIEHCTCSSYTDKRLVLFQP